MVEDTYVMPCSGKFISAQFLVFQNRNARGGAGLLYKDRLPATDFGVEFVGQVVTHAYTTKFSFFPFLL